MAEDWYEGKVEAVFGDALLDVVVNKVKGDGAVVYVNDCRGCGADGTCTFFVGEDDFTTFLDALRVAYNLGIYEGRYGEQEIPKMEE